MATDMARPNNRLSLSILLAITSITASAGEWQFDPSINIDETYSDNVSLEKNQKISSYVSQLNAGINAKFNSPRVEFSWQSNSTYATYSHDHRLDNDFRTLNAMAQIKLWQGGPAFRVKGNISNISRDGAINSLADLVSNDTAESQTYSAGFVYNIKNSHLGLDSSVDYLIRKTSDAIGENEGFVIAVNAENGNAARNLLWQLNGHYTERTNNGFNGRIYNIEGMVGYISPYDINPFIRYYDEDSTGNIGALRNTGTSSWGPGLRWRVSQHFYLDVSYNYAADKTVSDNYFSSAINWQPSNRTSLQASYNKRFFGDSYQLTFEHKNKRLHNSINYNESIQAFDRNSYRQVNIGNYWCPVDVTLSNDLNTCFVASNDNINFDNFHLVSIFDQQLVQGNEFSLNKTLNWQSELKLARTTFTLSVNNNKRESLTTGRIEDALTASLSMTRHISAHSNVKISTSFNHRQFDRHNVEGIGQEDFYRTIATTYSRTLARTLSSNVSLQYLDRNSTQLSRTYNEMRAIINIKKEF